MMLSTIRRSALAAGAAALPVLFLALSSSAPPRGDPPVVKANRYIGANACKNCHKADAKGAQFQHWEKTGHAKAYAQLASEEAKKVGEKLGVKEPQKSDQCLKCHVTAFGENKRNFKSSFLVEQGVQCETCHGPGENHQKTRLKVAAEGKGDPDARQTVPDDEIVKSPGPKQCVECHNEKSPTFKPFCYKERHEKIMHLDPRVKRTKEQLEKLGACDCEKCKKENEKKDKGKGDK